MAEEFLKLIVSKIGEYLLDATISQVGYLVHFKSNIEGLRKEADNLRLVQEHLRNDVDRARRNTEEIEGDVKAWLTDVSRVLADVQKLEEELQANKTCLNGLCPNWSWRYRLSKKAEKNASIMLKLQDRGKLFNRVSHRVTPPGIESFAPKDFMPSESRNYAFDKIIEALKDDKTNMVGLYGMGGVGKTTLAKVVAKKVKEEKNFDEVVMVTVSQNPDIKNIQGQIADLLDLELEKHNEERRASRLCLRLKNEKNILIILDDVWKKLDLTAIGIPFGNYHKGCKIFLTTRRLQVCVVMGCQAQIPLNVLNEKEGLTLLKRHAGVGDNSPTLNDMAIEVARECKGLPLAIVVIGSTLKGKDTKEWKVVSRKLRNSKVVDIENADEDIYGRLKLSYDYLKSIEIKLCFLMSSLFPEDYEISLEKLLRYGIGLGLYPDVTIEEARSEHHVNVSQLKDSCLLLEGKNENFVKMHDIVRDVALWITSHEKYEFMVKAGMRLTEWPKVEGLEHCTAISLIANDIKVLPNDLFCPKLEILLLEGAGRSTSKVPDEFFKEMKRLKVLNLNYWDLSLGSLQFLTGLQTLELISCKLRDTASFLGKPNKLRILRFNESYFDEFPKELGELSNLRLLDVDECDGLERIPSNVIRRCSQLEELYISRSFTKWEVEETSAEESNASLFELNFLPRLARLHLRIDSEFLPKDFAFPNLLCYVISVNAKYRQSYTRALVISGIKATSLIAFRALYSTVEYIYLKNIEGLQEVFQFEGLCHTGEEKHVELPSLTNLILKGLPQLSCGIHHLYLQNLKKVSISYCEKLQEVFQLEGLCHTEDEKLVVLSNLTLKDYHSTWPALEEFTISNCSNFGISFIAEVYLFLISSTVFSRKIQSLGLRYVCFILSFLFCLNILLITVSVVLHIAKYS